MKRTAKFLAALKVAPDVISDAQMSLLARGGNAGLYDALETAGRFWNAESGQWEDFKRSTSMFADDDGLATGQVRLRLMAHPKDIQRLKEVLTEALDTYGVTITDTSNEYPNRRGVGVRVYMTGQLPETKKRRGRQ